MGASTAQLAGWHQCILKSFGTDVGLARPAPQSSVTHTHGPSEQGAVSVDKFSNGLQAQPRLRGCTEADTPAPSLGPCNTPPSARRRGELACVWQRCREAEERNQYKQLSPNHSQVPQCFEKQQDGPKQSERPIRASFFKFTQNPHL